MQVGPDGAMYVINYAAWFGPATTTSIVRIDYTGTCRPVIATAIAPERPRALVKARGMVLEVEAEGAYTLLIGDVRGRTLASFRGEGSGRFDLAGLLGNRPGVYAAKVATSRGVSLQNVVLGPR
jgi:hypothetical protein